MRAFNVLSAELTADPADPAPYSPTTAARIGPAIGAAKLAGSVYELPPGAAVCPYHYEYEEEWLLVLSGEVTVRHPDGETVLTDGDVVAFPSGPTGAHQVANHSAASARVIMFSTVEPVGYSVYPDSNKIGFWTDSTDPEDRARVRRGENLDYYDGEPTAG